MWRALPDSVQAAISGEGLSGGILLVNRNKGQRGKISARIGASILQSRNPHRPQSRSYGWNALDCFAQAGVMADWLNLLMLACASVGAMAFGVLTAYSIFRAGFALLRPTRRQPSVKASRQPANVL